ncbi:MAG: isoprenyl transferase [Planctomycetaceae bacterium]|nr:isoprenyl transferase [Planctomycetaceae bacterium]
MRFKTKTSTSNATEHCEQPLSSEKKANLPKHVAIIMDGNGRWAQSRGMPRIEGHRRGAKSVRKTVELAASLGLEQLTLYCLSSENWKRPAAELSFLMYLLEKYLIEERKEIMRQKLQFSVIGRSDDLPKNILKEIDTTIKLTAGHTGMRLCLALNYGARGEIIDAVKIIAKQVQRGELDPEQIDEDVLSSHLYTAGMPDPDLLIRTSGEMRISNFLLWQISYSELWVTDKHWPEFEKEDFEAALQSYSTRNRRFGGLSST